MAVSDSNARRTIAQREIIIIAKIEVHSHVEHLQMDNKKNEKRAKLGKQALPCSEDSLTDDRLKGL